MGRTDTKIQINSVAAIERLIGGDSEVELELRRSIVVEFSKRYLKEVVADPAIRKATNDILVGVQKSMAEQIAVVKTDWRGQIEKVTFPEEVQAEIKKQTRKALDSLLNEHLLAIRDEILKEFREKAEFHVSKAIATAMLDVRKDTLARVKSLVAAIVEGQE
jgi:hypothetical protein